jgi:hypothetical protein
MNGMGFSLNRIDWATVVLDERHEPRPGDAACLDVFERSFGAREPDTVDHLSGAAAIQTPGQLEFHSLLPGSTCSGAAVSRSPLQRPSHHYQLQLQ